MIFRELFCVSQSCLPLPALFLEGGQRFLSLRGHGRTHLPEYMCRCISMKRMGSSM